MITITKERLLTIKQWRETYGPAATISICFVMLISGNFLEQNRHVKK